MYDQSRHTAGGLPIMTRTVEPIQPSPVAKDVSDGDQRTRSPVSPERIQMSDAPSMRAASATTDYEYNPEGLTGAASTLERITAILALRSNSGSDAEGSLKVRLSQLSPAYRNALAGELRLLRALLFSTGLFKSIENVDFG
jgi:hypothetical protein